MILYVLHNPLMRGEDLKPLQKALTGIKLYHGPIDGIFGVGSAQACKAAKYRLGYPAKMVVPTGGQRLLDYLQGKIALPLAYRIRRRARGYGLSKADILRADIVRWALWGANHEPQIHYDEGAIRANWLSHPAGTLPMSTDCSGFATACYRWSGAPDPNGLGYRAVGFTGTMLDHGITVPLFQAKKADLVIWGAAPGHHVAVIVSTTNKSDPMIVSHGSEAGPLHIHLSAETAAQQRSFVIKQYLGN